jgi:hypothetical protein
MNGSNTLVLCHAQMHQIVQEWLDRQGGALSACEVKAITEDKNRHTFEISVEPKPGIPQ